MVRRPSLPMSGGCVCGRHRYTITVLPLTVYACHCADCQTQSGSAFGMSMPVARSGFRVTGAEDLGTHLRAAASGRTVAGRFCTTCGTLEFAVFDPATIAFTQQNWMHVTPAQPSSSPPPPPSP